ncbi:MAG: protein translocase subunit SecDF [Bacteroidia bacterium]|nr:protein translocase subunit SecDF [Bacteroidia bacterium]
MRNKNTVLGLLVIFALICVYNLYHTWNAFSKDSKLKNADAVELAELTEDADFMKSLKNSQKNAFSYGLDLQGGMMVTLEIGVEDIVRELAGNPADDKDFTMAVSNAIAAKENSQESFVDLFYQEFQKIQPNVKLAAYYASADNGINFQTSNEEVLTYLRTQSDDAIQNTFNIIRSRIDQFGVSSPNLQLQEGSGRILVELPGVKDPERVRRLLRNTAKLEFWETYPYRDGIRELEKANDVVRMVKKRDGDLAVNDTTAKVEVDTAEVDKSAVVNDLLSENEGAEETAQTETPDSLKDSLSNDAFVDDSTLSDEERRAKFIERYPLFEKFQSISNEQLQGYPNTPLLGYMAIADTGDFNKWMRHPDVVSVLPNEIKFVWTAKSPVEDGEFLELIAIKYNAEGVPPLDGDVIEEARQDFESQGSKAPDVSMRMNVEGSRIWSDLTAKNVNYSIAIVLDGLVYSYPRVNQQISGGNSQITGNFTIEEAKDLATLLSAGKLPVKARIQGEDIVGPTLGEQNISKGMWSFLIAFLVTVAFMAFYYAGSGFVANVALIANLFFILGVSAALNVVLTLPGIAAIVLTMGMAVDANVLIFERIREEQALGKSLKASISAGFKNALSSVLDGNITTFLTGVVLFAFGIGPIRGFAVSLMIGIITSLISALFVSRLILDYFADKGGDSIKFGSKLTINAFNKVDVKMTIRKKLFYGVSGLLIAVSIFSFVANGFKTGVDFDGGRQYTLNFEKSLDENDNEVIRQGLTAVFDNNSPVIKTIGGENSLLITTSYLVDKQDKSEEVENLLLSTINGLNSEYMAEVESARLVGPTVANDIKRSAIFSILFSLVIIFLYIFVRFRKWQYSLGALVALMHDVTITLGIFSLLGALDFLPFSLEIDQSFIAAILTIVGYSINDTVIVFDRIRENLGEMKTSGLSDVYNTSINQTVSRTLITSGTTLATILILFLLGGDTMKGFMFALLVGIGVGTYSSIFVASPIAHDLINGQEKKATAQAQ